MMREEEQITDRDSDFARQDQIASAMWDDYQQVCQDRGIGGDSLVDDLSGDEYDALSNFLQ